MSKLIVFNNISLDGYFVDKKGDMSWAHNPVNDEEWEVFVQGNASGGGLLLFGRLTYELMAGYWLTEAAIKSNPVVAEGMNNLNKIVFSGTMGRAEWKNTRLVKTDMEGEIRKIKKESKIDMVIMGSGTIISQLTDARLIDEYQLVVVPVILGGGRTMFEGIKEKLSLKLVKNRAFKNGNVLVCYEHVQ